MSFPALNLWFPIILQMQSKKSFLWPRTLNNLPPYPPFQSHLVHLSSLMYYSSNSLSLSNLRAFVYAISSSGNMLDPALPDIFQFKCYWMEKPLPVHALVPSFSGSDYLSVYICLLLLFNSKLLEGRDYVCLFYYCILSTWHSTWKSKDSNIFRKGEGIESYTFW